MRAVLVIGILFQVLFLCPEGRCQCSCTASSDTTICKGTKAFLNVTAPYLIFGYQWSPAYGLNAAYYQNPAAMPAVTTTYTVSVSTLIDSNLIINGDFEDGNTGFTSNYIYNPTSVWNEGTYAVTTNPQSVHSNFSPCPDHTSGTGKMMVVNGAALANTSIWCETVTVLPNTLYAFSTWLCSVHPVNPAVLQFSINGVVLGSPFSATATTCQWLQFYEVWNSGTATSANICIVNQNTSLDGNDFALDDISFKPFCVAVDSVTVFVDHVFADAGPDTAVCRGDSVRLHASGGTGYHWDSGHNTQIVNLLPATDTIYFVTVTDYLGCKGEDSVRVSLLPIPQVEAGPDQQICRGDTAVLTASGGVSYTWTNGALTQTTVVSPPLTSSYYVTAVDTNGCENYDSLWVRIRPNPVISLGGDTEICPDSAASLTASGAMSYSWQPWEFLSDSTGQTVNATIQDNTTFAVVGTDEYGCRDTSYITVEVTECGLEIPNVFTPNDDMTNDLFHIDYKGKKKYLLKVYNRWGRLLFETEDKNSFWDGKCSGSPVPDGVYFYILTLDKDHYQGAVTVIRD